MIIIILLFLNLQIVCFVSHIYRRLPFQQGWQQPKVTRFYRVNVDWSALPLLKNHKYTRNKTYFFYTNLVSSLVLQTNRRTKWANFIETLFKCGNVNLEEVERRNIFHLPTVISFQLLIY